MPARLLTAVALAVICCLPTAATRAAEQTVSVVAVGEVQAKPDTVVFTGMISETSEKMKDAVTAFRDTRRRAMAAVKELGIENLKVETGALGMDLAGNMAGANPFGADIAEPAPEGSLTLSQAVSLTVTGLDQMEDQAVIDLVVSMLDGAREAGIKQSGMDQEAMMMMRMGMGAPATSAAVFKVSDPDAILKQATKSAMDNARKDAQFLAELAGGKIGRVVSIADAGVDDDNDTANPYAMIWGLMMDNEEGAYESPAYQPITVARGLSVTFELITE